MCIDRLQWYKAAEVLRNRYSISQLELQQPNPENKNKKFYDDIEHSDLKTGKKNK